jgi:hypothetical protein
MLHEYRDIISKLKVDNAHFAKIFEKHNDLDQKIKDIDNVKKAGASAIGAGSYFIYNGVHKAVLITYPSRDEINKIFK